MTRARSLLDSVLAQIGFPRHLRSYASRCLANCQARSSSTSTRFPDPGSCLLPSGSRFAATTATGTGTRTTTKSNGHVCWAIKQDRLSIAPFHSSPIGRAREDTPTQVSAPAGFDPSSSSSSSSSFSSSSSSSSSSSFSSSPPASLVCLDLATARCSDSDDMAPSKSGAPKYYAVRVGHESGVYFTWAQCQEQIRGFKGAQYKSFLSYQDATDFVAGRNPPDAAAAKPKGNRFYGVAAGHKTGVFTDWTEVTTLIHGYKNPKYKRFNTHDEAEAYVKGFNQSASKKRALRGAEKYNVDYDDDDDVDDDVDDDEFDEDALEEALAMPPAKRAKSTADLDRSRSAGSADSTAAVLEIYTDGSSRGNGRAGAEAGVGVYFGLSDPRNVSERLPGLPQTNQRAELFAIARALQQSADHDGDIRIFTDSNYAIKCLTEWCDKWIQNNWMNDSAAPVKNQDLIKLGLEEMAKVEDRGHRVELRWVKGHGSNVGNIAADQLAVAGSRKPPVTGI